MKEEFLLFVVISILGLVLWYFGTTTEEQRKEDIKSIIKGERL